MIYYFTPYSKIKDLGKEYNHYMRLIGEDDSACFLDGDVAFLVPEFGSIIERYSELYPSAVLTARTNRIHRLSRQLDGEMDEECNMRELIKKAEGRKHLTSVTEIKNGEGLSGFLMVVPRKIWKEVPFKEGIGLLGVDSQFRIDLHLAGVPTLIMDALFVFHSYRLLNGHSFKNHLV